MQTKVFTVPMPVTKPASLLRRLVPFQRGAQPSGPTYTEAGQRLTEELTAILGVRQVEPTGDNCFGLQITCLPQVLAQVKACIDRHKTAHWQRVEAHTQAYDLLTAT